MNLTYLNYIIRSHRFFSFDFNKNITNSTIVSIFFYQSRRKEKVTEISVDNFVPLFTIIPRLAEFTRH